jgi:hypothetical protein
MGWWKARGTEAVIGHEPLDVLGAPAGKVVRQYEASFGRRPTIAEWEAVLRTVLTPQQSEYKFAENGVPTEVRITPPHAPQCGEA